MRPGPSAIRLVLLRAICDTMLKRFEVPQIKLDKLEAVLRRADSTGYLTFAMLDIEKLAGKSVRKCQSCPLFFTPTIWTNV